MMKDNQSNWEWEIRPRSKWLELNVQELLSYKDLLFRLVRRDFLMLYQQTLLGPAWIILQPVLTVLTYILVFNRWLGIPTNGVPAFLFYLTGITLWNLFSDIFTGTASIFISNANIFSKVYFPRLIVPLSTTLLHLMRLGIQLLLLIAVIFYFHFTQGFPLHAGTWLIALLPMLMAAGMGLAWGLLFSVLTARYRDLMNLLHLLVRLLMIVCPIFFSISYIQQYRWLVNLNPLSSLFELFRYAFIGAGTFTAAQLVYSAGVMLILLAGGIILFNKKADALLDVV
ncbi:MAG TPA: ABC transporter permease [Chitinophagaceae bacterium]|nr:ABC transporter permease [Chitinophagaceae bacterium]